jgi:hypothetical protein
MVSPQIMPDATSRPAVAVGILLRVELISFLHYGLVSLVALAALATLWFAGYVVYRLHND